MSPRPASGRGVGVRGSASNEQKSVHGRSRALFRDKHCEAISPSADTRDCFVVSLLSMNRISPLPVFGTACPSPPPLSPEGRGDCFPSPAKRERGGGEGGHRFKAYAIHGPWAVSAVPIQAARNDMICGVGLWGILTSNQRTPFRVRPVGRCSTQDFARYLR